MPLKNAKKCKKYHENIFRKRKLQPWTLEFQNKCLKWTTKLPKMPWNLTKPHLKHLQHSSIRAHGPNPSWIPEYIYQNTDELAKLSYNSKNSSKRIIYVIETPKTPTEILNYYHLSFIKYLIRHASKKERILDQDHDQFWSPWSLSWSLQLEQAKCGLNMNI